MAKHPGKTLILHRDPDRTANSLTEIKQNQNIKTVKFHSNSIQIKTTTIQEDNINIKCREILT
jgi:hypothetical protein